MAGIASFKELEVYKKAYDVSIDIHKISLSFPKTEQYGLTSQIQRASKSICANIAEGFVKQRGSKAEFKRFLLIALGSASEMLVWIDYCYDMQYISTEKHQRWTEEYDSINKMLNSFYSKVEI
jgi:four helix bundle protein